MQGRSQNKIRINNSIRTSEVRLIDEKGEQLGIRTLEDALNYAKRANLDLVEVSPKAKPPVCKIMDFGKYKYELAKKAKENKKSQKNFAVKEIKFRIKIDVGDFNTKVSKGIKFLQDGHRLKIIIMFRGREVVYKDKGYELQDRIVEAFAEYGTVDKKGRLEGHNIQFQVSPKQVNK